MQYKPIFKALVNISRIIYDHLNQLTSHITRYQNNVANKSLLVSIADTQQQIASNNALIEALSEAIHILTQQQQVIDLNNFE